MSCKVIILLARRDDMSADDFRRWYVDEHAPLARGLPGIRRLVFNVCEGNDDVDGASEQWFDDRADAEAAYASEAGQRIAADSLAHVRSRVRMFVTEHVVVDEAD